MLNIMKQKLFFVLTLTFIISSALSSCAKKKNIDFCEGASTAGIGINCGTVFAYGDLTAIIKSKEPFGADSISIKIQIQEGGKFIPVETISVNIKPDETKAIINIPLYKKGIYEITAHRGDKVYAKENIEIAE